MKNILFLLLVATTLVQGQSTFNKQIDFEFPFHVVTSVLPTDSCYYAIGVITDTSEAYTIGNIFLRFDLWGELEYFKKLTSTERFYETWLGDLTPTEDGGFLAIGMARDSISRGLIIKYDGDGDTLFTREFTNPLYPLEDFIYSAAIRPDGNGNYFVLCGHDTSIDPAPANGDIYLLKIDPDGSILEGYTYGDGSMQNPYSMILDSAGGVVIGSNKSNTNTAEQGYTSRTHVFKVDTSGSVKWQYLSPSGSLFDHASDMIKTSDGGMVVATGKGIEHYVVAGANSLRWFPYMFKLDADHKFEWGREFRGTRQSIDFSMAKIVPAVDGSGYVGVSRIGEDVTIGEEILGSWVVKASLTGDSVWTRYYSFLDGVKSEPNPYDLKNTPDGGYLICGETRPNGSAQNRAWLMKLDQHGCLVPGCHLLDDVDEAAEMPIELAIYPNPTSGFLNFQLRGTVPGKGGLFRVADASGKTIRSFGAGQQGDTMIVPVSDWSSGTYFLQYLLDGQVVVSEKFIKH